MYLFSKITPTPFVVSTLHCMYSHLSHTNTFINFVLSTIVLYMEFCFLCVGFFVLI